MALPDISGLTTDELGLLGDAVKAQRASRGRFDNLHDFLLDELRSVKAMGFTKAQVGKFLTDTVNEIYP